MDNHTKRDKHKGLKFPAKASENAVEVPKAEDDKDLDDYLNTEFNLETYEDLTESDWKNTFDDPLAFFQLLYEQFNFIKDNKSKPTKIIKTLYKPTLNEEQHHYLFHSLLERLTIN